jgi:penicillin-binding protein 1A
VLRSFGRGVAGVWGRRGGRLGILGTLAALGFLAGFSWERCGLAGCPSVARLASFQPGGAPVVYDARGGVLAELSPSRWEVVRIRDLPEYVPAAFVAVEDKRFYGHHGVDWRRFAGTMLRNLKPGARGQGASTITMQVARNVFPDRLPAADRTPRRKILEIRVAREIEDRLSKEEILQLYLNHIYFGEGVYGIESAARVYFGKRARDLKLSEAALLAGLPKAPSHYNPRKNRQRSVQRRNVVLSLMAQQGLVTAAQAAEAKAAEPRLARWTPERKRRRAPYYVEQVRRVMEARFGEELYGRSLRIHTPLLPGVQAAVERTLVRQLERIEAGEFGRMDAPRRADFKPGMAETPYLQGAATIIRAETGDVLALVGGRDFAESGFDRMTQGFRQPGSAFKPFVYAAAVDAGIPPTEKVDDAPLRLVLPAGDVWEPRNFDGRFRGPVTVRRSLRESVNTVAVRLAQRVGIDRVRSVARRMGISTPIAESPSVAIGASAVRPMELAAAYTAFANLGDRAAPRWVTRVEDRDGTVWIGFDRPRPIVRDGSGGVLAAPVWGRMVAAAQDGAAPEWEPPRGVVQRQVVSATGQVLVPGCRARGDTYQESFLRTAVPEEVCPAGEPYGGGIEGWIRRKLEDLDVGLEDWASRALDRALRGIGEALSDAVSGDGEGGGEEEALAEEEPSPPSAEEAPPRRREDRAVVPVEPEPERRPRRGATPDTLVIRSGPRDTLVIPGAR